MRGEIEIGKSQNTDLVGYRQLPVLDFSENALGQCIGAAYDTVEPAVAIKDFLCAIRHATMRSPGPKLSSSDMSDIDRLLSRLAHVLAANH